jgi:D-alanyl-D-alanine endopeptidase (penicillin-binding protein 7)
LVEGLKMSSRRSRKVLILCDFFYLCTLRRVSITLAKFKLTLATESIVLTSLNSLFSHRAISFCTSLCLLVPMALSSQAAENDKPQKAVGTSKSSTNAKPSGNAKSSGNAKPSGNAKSAANSKNNPKATNNSRKVVKAKAQDTRVSHGRMAGLHQGGDDLELRSSVALVIDQDTHEVLIRKNDNAVLPIASLTKLMTGLVISEANLSQSDMIAITQEDVDTEKGSTSRLAVGSVLSRGDLMHLSLMSSENRAAHALGRTYPGGLSSFVKAMNERAKGLGMGSTHFVEPTGLSSRNQSSANDLAVLVGAAYNVPLLRELSTSHGREVAVGRRTLQYNTTNRLVKSPNWDIGLQKTGYISEAGQCLVMQTKVAGRQLIMVFLDSAGKLSRIADAERVRRWVENQNARTEVAMVKNSG